MPRAKLVLVDDEELLRNSLAKSFSNDGLDVIECGSAEEARGVLSQGDYDAAIIDLRLPDGSGLDLAREMMQRCPSAPVIVLTAYSTVDGAVEAIKLGAYDYLTKPVPLDKLALTVRRALETSKLRSEVSDVRRDLQSRFGLTSIVAADPAMRKVLELVEEVARSDARTIMVRGESGAGKSLIARAIHYGSPRQDRPFVQITCTTLQDTLLESELFGHERGAFTDAKAMKRGLFEVADGGTVFLDEVSEMSDRLQAKVLQVLDDQTFRRIGGVEDLRVNVRIVAATNRDIEQLVREHQFREDLYYRLNVIPVFLPPLRQRKEDIPELVRRFIGVYSREFRKAVVEVAPGGMEILMSHSWPGNVRELKNVVERAVLLAKGTVLQPEELVIGAPIQTAASSFRIPPEGIVLEELERDLLVQALGMAKGNLVKTAKLLGITRDTLRYRIKKYGLKVPSE
ncbi:MAG: sigma-54-dependent Fis family transcriptional regulator [Planctomycetes bacterium]|nr:sigma-54-dependent Fis family transcriptional regulator [Planctomycetota bacterium]